MSYRSSSKQIYANHLHSGGLGLTGGLVDVEGLYQCLTGIHNGLADESILDRYSEIRRLKYQTLTDPMSTANIRLLFDSNPDTALQDSEILQMVKKGEKDEEFTKQGLLVGSRKLYTSNRIWREWHYSHPVTVLSHANDDE